MTTSSGRSRGPGWKLRHDDAHVLRSWLLAKWDALWGSYWFLPAVLSSVGAALGVLLPYLDGLLRIEAVPTLAWLATTAGAARHTVTTIASAIVTITSITFSITMLTLSLTTSQFGSRLLRTFMTDGFTQFCLGSFLSTVVYCVLATRAIREESPPFVPHLTTAVAVGMGLLCLGLLIYFLHHIAVSIQVQTVVKVVAAEIDASMDRLFPETMGDGPPGKEPDPRDLPEFDVKAPEVHTVAAAKEGYLQIIATHGLLEWAENHDAVVHLLHRPGHFVTRSRPLAYVHRKGEWKDAYDAKINAAFNVGNQRTPRQDFECAINELVEVAVRALSPGINDPFTAVTCVDRLGATLCRLAKRKIPSPYRYDKKGSLRVICVPETFAMAVDAAFNQIRQYGQQSPAVIIRLLEAIERIALCVERSDDREALRRHTEMIDRSAKRCIGDEEDLADVARRVESIRRAIDVRNNDGAPGRPDLAAS